MTKSGERLLDGAKEALRIAKGDEPAARIHVNGWAYVPEAERVVAAAMAADQNRPRYFPCDCGTAHHFLRIDADEDLPGKLNVSFVSTRNASFWHRLKWAWLHVFGSQELTFADAVIDRQSLEDNLTFLRERAARLAPYPAPTEGE